ncbi:signal peptidase I [Anaerosacchariphilus polymeriproducens]|uniref:Signal peptidase I n=1 Tax=Anaerosacchariphilus polymeriproducens TaxID=1812858 RepID=A0A371ATR2_9FIRM|nr:signal peptidase I [Anaerosacchariphilus polymeriproducens]RDU22929.1 signal peptidase I [Anaerosacchariphilus polymeriproducens]
MKEENKKGLLREIIELIVYIAVVLGITFLIVTFVGQRTQVSGPSMMNTLNDGDNLIVDKISYRFSSPKRFDIIVFPYKYQKKTYYIKRIIGLPGETVQIVNGSIYINGEVLKEIYGKEVMTSAGQAANPIKLSNDEYFVLGDNRNNSSDSRAEDVGMIKRSDIVGRAWMRIWPLSDIGILKHQ